MIAPQDFFNRQLTSWNEHTLGTVTTPQYATTTIFWVLTGAQKQRKGHDCSIGFLQQTTEIVTWEHLGHCFYTLVFHHYPLSDECEHRVAMILLIQTCMVCKIVLYNQYKIQTEITSSSKMCLYEQTIIWNDLIIIIKYAIFHYSRLN